MELKSIRGRPGEERGDREGRRESKHDCGLSDIMPGRHLG